MTICIGDDGNNDDDAAAHNGAAPLFISFSYNYLDKGDTLSAAKSWQIRNRPCLISVLILVS